MPYRHGYFATTTSEHGRAAVFDKIAHYDFLHRRKLIYALPSGDFTSEPIFVARTPDAVEGNGYLLAVVYRGREHRSDLVVLDATDIQRGPLAVAALETRVPFGFHGCWMSGD